MVKALQEMSFISEYIKPYNWNKLLAISIAIWGRSMGATSAILYTSNNASDNIIGLILDSPFLNLSQLCFDQIKTYVLHVKKNVENILNLRIGFCNYALRFSRWQSSRNNKKESKFWYEVKIFANI